MNTMKNDFCNPVISAGSAETARYIIEGDLDEGDLYRVYKCSECGRWHARTISVREVNEALRASNKSTSSKRRSLVGA